MSASACLADRGNDAQGTQLLFENANARFVIHHHLNVFSRARMAAALDNSMPSFRAISDKAHGQRAGGRVPSSPPALT
jgi:hypothetical protein